jgi:Heavy metal binding domain
MKKIILASMLAAAIVFAACNNTSNTNSESDTTAMSKIDTSKMMSGVKYTCTMHPEVISDTPGHCPKCGMEMVPIKDTTANKK